MKIEKELSDVFNFKIYKIKIEIKNQELKWLLNEP